MTSAITATKILPIQAIILTGGRGNRLGGQDKGLIEVHGKRLIDYVSNVIYHQVDNIMISANRHKEIYQKTGFQVIEDTIGDYAGPLAGILSALQTMNKDELLFCCPVDMPVLSEHIVSDLYKELERQQADICCVQTGERIQPLIAIMRTRVIASLRAYLESDQHKVMSWIKQQNLCTYIIDNTERPMININNEHDLQEFIKHESV